MELTPKQVRNGISAPTGAPTTARPGPDARSEIVSAMATAKAAGDHGASGTSVTSTKGFTVVDWETGVGGHDQPGEA